MSARFTAILLFLTFGLATPAQAVHIHDFDLDALDVDQSYIGLELDAADYRVSLRSGKYVAWSAWSTTSDDCTDDCAQGWLNFYGIYNVATESGGYVENGTSTPFGEYDFTKRLAYATPESALATAGTFAFTLEAPTLFFFFIDDCEGCFGDNRGGLSFRLVKVPEPGSLGLLALGFGAAGLMRLQRRATAAR